MDESITDNSVLISVSVIVTTYNQADTLSQTLDSILAQKCRYPIEIIIGDDCSTDGSRNLCIEYQNRYPEIIRSLFHTENVGVAANFALCVKQAKGKYIALCAADDFWHNNLKLQMQVDFLDKHLDYGMVYTDYDKFNIRSRKIKENFLIKSKIKLYEGSGLIGAFFQGKVAALTLTVMLRKELILKYVPLDDYIKYKFPSEDWITWLIISKYSKIGCIPISTSTYRYGHESLSNIRNYADIEKRYEKEHLMYKYLCNYLPNDLHYNEKEFLKYVNGILLNFAYKKIDYKNASLYAKRLIILGSKNIKVLFANYWLSFMLYAFLKYIRCKFND